MCPLPPQTIQGAIFESTFIRRIVSSFILEGKGHPTNDTDETLWSMERMQAYLCYVKSLRPKLTPESNRLDIFLIIAFSLTFFATIFERGFLSYVISPIEASE